jgi:hypothetical protein
MDNTDKHSDSESMHFIAVGSPVYIRSTPYDEIVIDVNSAATLRNYSEIWQTNNLFSMSLCDLRMDGFSLGFQAR